MTNIGYYGIITRQSNNGEILTKQLSMTEESGYTANRQRINPDQKLPVVLVNDLPSSTPAVLALDLVVSPKGVLTMDFDIYKKSDIHQEDLSKCYWVANAKRGVESLEGYGARWRAYVPAPQIVTRKAYMAFSEVLAQYFIDIAKMIEKFKDNRWIFNVEDLYCGDEVAIKHLNATGFSKLNAKLTELYSQFSVFDFETLEGYEPMTARKFLTSLEPEYTNQFFEIVNIEDEGAFRVSFDGLNGYTIEAKEERTAFKFKDGKKGYWGVYDLELDKNRILVRMQDAAKSQGLYLTGFNRGMEFILKPIRKYIADYNVEERNLYEKYVSRETNLLDAEKKLVSPNGLSTNFVSTESKIGRALLPPTPLPVVEVEEVSEAEQKEIEKKAATRAKKPRATSTKSPRSTTKRATKPAAKRTTKAKE